MLLASPVESVRDTVLSAYPTTYPRDLWQSRRHTRTIVINDTHKVEGCLINHAFGQEFHLGSVELADGEILRLERGETVMK